MEAAAGADLLIHECFQSPAVFARATGLPLEVAVNLTRLAHTVPEQMGRILERTQPRMGALWHLDLTPGVDAVFDELGAHYQGPVTVSQDLTVFNVTAEAVVARQATVNDAAPPVHGPSHSTPAPEAMPAPPSWWADALLDRLTRPSRQTREDPPLSQQKAQPAVPVGGAPGPRRPLRADQPVAARLPRRRGSDRT